MKVDAFMFGYQIGRQSSVIWKSEAEVRKPIAYLYNGVRLPALPEWDREEYPYAIIRKKSSGAYAFECFNTPVVKTVFVGSDGIRGQDIPYKLWCYELKDDTWVADYLYTYIQNEYLWTSLDDNSFLVWANHDIMDIDNNSLYLAKSTPIPIYNEPVNYLYNGVKLPKLPEWDKTVYPYVVVMASTNVVSIVALSSPAHMVFVEDGEYYVGVNAGTTYLSSATVSASGEFTTLRSFSEKTADDVALFSSEPDWANYDILNADGSVYLAASEPIPIYE